MFKTILKRIIRSWIVTMGICGTLTAATIFAQAQENQDYEVRKGDTLWSISSREMSDPFSWPKIWKENPEIKNPNLIYPGQKIRLPQLYIQKEIIRIPASPPAERAIPAPEIKPQPQVKQEELPGNKKEEIPVKIKAVEKKYLVERDTLISSGYISDSIESRGQVIGSPSEREVLGRVDYAYVKTLNPVRTGDRFYIVRPAGKVKHPETGAMMGYLVDVLGIVSVVGKESGETKAEITASYSDIAVGDLLLDYYDIDLPLQPENLRNPDITGFIIATKDRKVSNGQPDIVYIDKGRKSGIMPGDILAMTARANFNAPNGLLQVISTRDSTSTAIIRASQEEVSVGDTFGPSMETIAQLFPLGEVQDNVQNEIKVFIDQYIQAYELGDIDKFMLFYSKSAIENNSLRYDEIRNVYQKNFENSRYTYSLRDPLVERSNGNVILTGTYIIKRIVGEPLGGITQGHIRWTLTRENGALKILSVDYDRL
ncbi:MAG TPA: LysM peptidoglycan-binding domain-containing protein [Thermodesulfovibrionales bacterium]|nr:LysM peptidoglycan-binding domain-containing protein [Thermodesulfovibrionales bacterium]